MFTALLLCIFGVLLERLTTYNLLTGLAPLIACALGAIGLVASTLLVVRRRAASCAEDELGSSTPAEESAEIRAVRPAVTKAVPEEASAASIAIVLAEVLAFLGLYILFGLYIGVSVGAFSIGIFANKRCWRTCVVVAVSMLGVAVLLFTKLLPYHAFGGVM